MSISWMCDKLCSYEGIGVDVEGTKERPPFLKDYGAIIHRYGFRRLSNKTQVYLNPLNDFPRTRLTHSVEVEQIGRELSRCFSESVLENLSFSNACNFNKYEFKTNFEDLVAASCLAHDIGQAPFGHKGEQTLNYLMIQEKIKKINCFEANKQNVRVLLGCRARKPYGVSCALVDAVMKYKSSTFKKKSKYPGHYLFESKIIDRVVSLTGTEGVRHPVCYIMEAADDIAYITSDLQDSLKIDLIGKDDIYNILKDVNFPDDLPDVEIKSWNELIDYAFNKGDYDKLTSSLLKLMIKTVKSNIKHLFNNHSKGCVNDLPAIMHDFFSVDNCSLNILYFGYGGIYEKIKRNIYDNYILECENIIGSELLAEKVITDLWGKFKSELIEGDIKKSGLYKILPKYVQDNIKRTQDGYHEDQLYNYISDYISGMTDQYAVYMWEKLFNPANLKNI